MLSCLSCRSALATRHKITNNTTVTNGESPCKNRCPNEKIRVRHTGAGGKTLLFSFPTLTVASSEHPLSGFLCAQMAQAFHMSMAAQGSLFDKAQSFYTAWNTKDINRGANLVERAP
eukprot:3495-Heterococcus_DN1.PRE.4